MVNYDRLSGRKTDKAAPRAVLAQPGHSRLLLGQTRRVGSPDLSVSPSSKFTKCPSTYKKPCKACLSLISDAYTHLLPSKAIRDIHPIIDPEEDYLTIVAVEQTVTASEAKRKKELEEAHANFKGCQLVPCFNSHTLIYYTKSLS